MTRGALQHHLLPGRETRGGGGGRASGSGGAGFDGLASCAGGSWSSESPPADGTTGPGPAVGSGPAARREPGAACGRTPRSKARRRWNTRWRQLGECGRWHATTRRCHRLGLLSLRHASPAFARFESVPQSQSRSAPSNATAWTQRGPYCSACVRGCGWEILGSKAPPPPFFPPWPGQNLVPIPARNLSECVGGSAWRCNMGVNS
jgi:hypothetical protein